MHKRVKKILKIRHDEPESYRQIINYLIGGGLYFWTGYFAFFVFSHQLKWTLFPATILSSIVGWTFNYFINRYWVFKHHELKKKALKVTSKYITLTLFNFVLNYLIIRLLKSIGISPYISQFISSVGFFTIWNYYWYKLWVFKPPKSTKR